MAFNVLVERLKDSFLVAGSSDTPLSNAADDAAATALTQGTSEGGSGNVQDADSAAVEVAVAAAAVAGDEAE